MQYPPISVLATWPTPNYVNPVTRGDGLTIVISLFFSLAILTVGLRIFTRLHITKGFGMDDVFAILALFPATAYAVIALLSVLKFGINRHVWDVPYDWNILTLKFTIAAQVLFSLASCLAKLSMLILVSRMVASSTNSIRYAIWAAMALVTMSSLAFALTITFQCTPLTDYWTLTYSPQNCLNESANLLAAGIINSITDFCVVLIPIPIVWKLNMNSRVRLSIICLFATGLFVCLSAIVRTYYTYKLNVSNDKTWDGYNVYLTGSLELFVGIICCSIPPIKPFMKRYYPTFLSTITSNSRSNNNSKAHSSTSSSTNNSNRKSGGKIEAAARFSSRFQGSDKQHQNQGFRRTNDEEVGARGEVEFPMMGIRVKNVEPVHFNDRGTGSADSLV